MIERERIQDTIGGAIGGGTFAIKKAVEVAKTGFDWDHFSQEMIEDLSGAIISVTVGFFLMKLWRNIFPEKKSDAVK
jgi:hypothetical protein